MPTPVTTTFNIVQVIDRLHIGGAERVLVTLSNLLYEHGHHVTVLTTVTPGPLAESLHKNIPLVNLNRRSKWNPFTMLRLIKTVRKFDIVHVHSRHNLRYLWLAKKIFGLKTPVFYHEHHGYRIHTSATALEKKMFARVVFIAVSEQLKAWAIQKACTNESQTFTLANTVIRYVHDKALTARKESAFTELVMTGNFVPVKNMAFAIQILAYLNAAETRYKLTIIGSVADKNYYESIVALVSSEGQEKYVRYITDCKNIQPILHQFDLAIHTASSESGPLVLVEYIAQGLPFVTYETGEVTAQVKEALPASVINNFNVEDWAGRIRLIQQQDKLKTGAQLAAIFEAYYSAAAYYQKCMNIYDEGLQHTNQ